MDGNNGQSETGVDAMAKLEEDLQKLTNETETNIAPSQTSDPQLDNEVVAPPQETPQAPPTFTEPTTTPEVTTDVQPSPVVPPEPKKGSPMLIISLGLVVVALLAAIAYVIGIKFFSGTPKQIACTTEAKVCDDGTSVGRSGPNCEFDACPEPVATPEAAVDLKIYENKSLGFSFNFPAGLNIYGDVYKDKKTVVLVTKETEGTVSPGGWSGVFVSVLSNPLKLTSRAYIQKVVMTKDPLNSNVIIKDASTADIDASIAEGEVVGGNSDATPKIYISKGDQVFLIDPTSLIYVELSNQILSSFKFINGVTSVPVSSPSATPKGY